MWADTLTTAEVDATLKAADELSTISWASPLLLRTKPIIERLRKGMTGNESCGAAPFKPSDKSLLFEIRFARALAAVPSIAKYEYSAGVGVTKVDFRVDLGVSWLVELVSLHESERFQSATWTAGAWQGYILGTDSSDSRQSEAGETIKAQERILAKVFDRKKQQPIKFPKPNGSVHMVIVDARGFMGDGDGDADDWHQIVHGANDLQHWENPRTGTWGPVLGLFEPTCPLDGSAILRERVHFIGFVCERDFSPEEIARRTVYVCNPALAASEQAARELLSQWPLRPLARDKAVTLVAKDGEQIICSNGHICGSVTEDVYENEPITSNVIRIRGGTGAIANDAAGHICVEPGCGEAVTIIDGFRVRIRTSQGWIG